MKHILPFLLCGLLLTACTPHMPSPTELPTEFTETTAPASVTFTIYTPNENADGFYHTDIVIDTLHAQNVVDALIEAKVLNDGIRINSERLEGSRLFLDFNSAFCDQLKTYGTSGELMMIGSVVNTFLSAYGADSLIITADGEIMESGHVIYDFPLEFTP